MNDSRSRHPRAPEPIRATRSDGTPSEPETGDRSNDRPLPETDDGSDEDDGWLPV